MPLYEFKCETCQETFEELISSNEIERVKCPKCSSPDIKKLLSSGSIRMGVGKAPAPSEKCGGCCMAKQCGMDGHS